MCINAAKVSVRVKSALANWVSQTIDIRLVLTDVQSAGLRPERNLSAVLKPVLRPVILSLSNIIVDFYCVSMHGCQDAV